MCLSKRLRFIIFLSALVLVFAHAGAVSAMAISGIVVDDTGCPIVGASVLLVRDGLAIAGRATDGSGRYTLTTGGDTTTAELRISAVGFSPVVIPVAPRGDVTLAEIQLLSAPPDMGTIRVTPQEQPTRAQVTTAVALREHARRALVPSDPISSLDGPAAARQGSSHSAQVRVDGTNPKYFLNSLTIGTDPSHYGAFAIIPMSVISQMRFYSHGTQANFGAPSAVELATTEDFSKHRTSEVQVSTIDVTARQSMGTGSFSLLGSVRKSVLDEIVTNIDASSDRQTIPPTSFLDLFVSAGWRLSSVYTVTLDQYHVRDHLRFNTSGATDGNDGVDTYQKTTGSYAGLRVKALYPGVLLRGSFGIQGSNKAYSAHPQTEGSNHFSLDLREESCDNTFNLSAEWTSWGTSLELGTQGLIRSRRDIAVEQNGWNFLPPFANSNNAYIYQEALNGAWGQHHGSAAEFQQAVYLTAERNVGRLTMRGGLRTEYFAALRQKSVLVNRASLSYQPDSRTDFTLFHGTFAESPADNILEPYQVLITADRGNLSALKTDMWSLDVNHRDWNLSLFHKQITDRPVVTPDYSQVDYARFIVSPSFLTVQSSGSATFTGGSINWDRKQFPSKEFDTRLWYGYTLARKVENGISTPYELNAPHRFGGSLDWHATKRWLVGGELQIRSGYPYTPTREARRVRFSEYYSPAYYETQLANENSLRFPTSAFVNLHAGYSYPGGAVYVSISNVTNRANPIVNSSSGYIYDAGILPMVGFEFRF